MKLTMVLLSLLVGVVGGFSYLVFVNNIIIVINIIVVIVFVILLALIISGHHKEITRQRLMFDFIELIVFNLNVQKTLEATFIIVEPLLAPSILRKLQKLKTGDGVNKILGLQSYFSHLYYDSFCELILVTVDRGVNILKVSEVLLTSIRGTRTQLISIAHIDNNYLAKFSSHWLFIMIVVLAFKYSLANMFTTMTSSLHFMIGVEIFLAIFLGSIFLVINNRVKANKNVK